jgi:uncharacterized membrane protein (UPF0127 family)
VTPRSKAPSFLRPMTRNTSQAWGLRNVSSGRIIAATVIPAFDRATRNRGLLGRRSLAPDSAMILAPCSSVHTFFMKFPIDVVFVSRAGQVLKVRAHCRPWRLAVGAGAFATIELPEGAAEATATNVGDQLEIV